MERLTKKIAGRVILPIVPMSIENEDDLLEYHKVTKQYNQNTIKLAKYEDLEEQGLLLKLPCKVGDTVYVKIASCCDIQYAEAEVRDFTYFTSCGFCVVITSKHSNKQNIPFSEFGKTVFLTQAEAEQKLKEDEEIQEGDTVRVVDTGKSYTTYVRFFSDNNISTEVAAKYMYTETIEQQTLCKVLAKHKHRITNVMVYVLESVDGKVYLVGEEGIEKV